VTGENKDPSLLRYRVYYVNKKFYDTFPWSLPYRGAPERCSTWVASFLTLKYEISLKILFLTNALTYFAPQPDTTKNVLNFHLGDCTINLFTTVIVGVL
jgi:hypothetical protein